MGNDLDRALQTSGENRSELEKAINHAPKDQSEGMTWLISHMPDEDLKVMSAEFLLSNCDLAYNARNNTSWGRGLSDEVFFEYVLP